MKAPFPLQIKILNSQLHGSEYGVPRYATLGAAGFDLRYMPNNHADAQWFRKHESVILDTGVAVYVKDPAYVGLLIARSSLQKKGLCLANGVGVIDSDYQGPLKVPVYNMTHKNCILMKGERIAQLLIVPMESALFQIVHAFDDETNRGSGSFGHTGQI